MNSPPTTLGQYQIIREIARSNDIVYEAYDPLMNRRVAIKELAMPQGASGPQQEERINRFKREAQAAGSLNHPNIMTVFIIAEDGGRTFMAMEYLDGGTLRNEIDTKGFIPVDRAIDITINVLEGLSHAHSKGVIHRDIKPDNIQILSNGTIKITDFGIARLTFQENLTMDGQVFGTPSYMSPEQVVGKDIDQRSDLFSVGVVLYEMISGQKPFSGDSVVSITYAIMNATPPQPAQADYGLWQVLSRALDKSPQVRYANADEMIKALRDVQAAAKSGIAGAISGPTPTNYGTNPYLTPPPMPQAPPQPVYAYNPYMAQQAIVPPPAQYPSPYQTTPYQTTPYQHQYQAGPSMPPPGAFPIYYPPPPRQPLMKPETASFLKRLTITFVLVGTLLILLLVGLGAILDSLKNASRDGMDNNKLPDSIANLPANMPVPEKITFANNELTKPHSDGQTAEIKRYVSRLYDQDGKTYLGRADLARAELKFRNGADSDATNPAVWTDLALVLEREVDGQADVVRRASLLKEAGDDWSQAFGYETQSDRKQQEGKGAVQAYLAYAQAVVDSGDHGAWEAARERLYAAKSLAAGDVELRAQIDAMLAKLS